jgi:protein-S-isoprenylcysteine O-methyltransferase Ste14
MSRSTVRLGTVLFQFRSFTPLPVLVLLGWLLWRSRGEAGPGGAEVDGALNAVGLLVAAAGQALRFYTLGQVPEGTSGQGAVLQAVVLNTLGPYAYVRNPLYVGNLGICLGLMLIAHDPAVYAVGLLFFFGEYYFIIRAEESFLAERFGQAFADFLVRVPRWIPRLTPAYPRAPRTGFDARRALKKEHNPFAAWASGALLLWGWELAARHALTPGTLALLGALEATVLAAFAVIKAHKRGWLAAPAASARAVRSRRIVDQVGV